MKTLIFHGSLRALFPEDITVEADTVAEAVSALQHRPGARGMVRPTVVIRGFYSRDALYEKTDVTEIHLEPAMVGAGAWARIIVGIIFIIVGALTSWCGGGFLIGIGISLVAGGIMQLLAPTPQAHVADDRSRYISGTKNTVEIGTPIPLIYGTRKAYGHYISFDIDSGDFNQSPASWYASNYTDYSTLNSATAPHADYTPALASGPDSVYPINTIRDGEYYVAPI